MKDPQIISVAGENPDLFLTVWGGYVFVDSGTSEQVLITSSPIDVRIDLLDITTGAARTVRHATMTYDTSTKWWKIPFTEGAPTLGSQLFNPPSLPDRHKYVARVSEDTATSHDMRDFALAEFAVDNGSFEESLMRLPFEVKSHPDRSAMYIIWYSVGNIGVEAESKFMAAAYEGGSGTTPATDASRVTHRSEIITYAA